MVCHFSTAQHDVQLALNGVLVPAHDALEDCRQDLLLLLLDLLTGLLAATQGHTATPLVRAKAGQAGQSLVKLTLRRPMASFGC